MSDNENARNRSSERSRDETLERRFPDIGWRPHANLAHNPHVWSDLPAIGDQYRFPVPWRLVDAASFGGAASQLHALFHRS
jgi:hypothetical protein